MPPVPNPDSERDAQTIMDSIPGLLAIFSSAGEVEHVNRKVLEYFGKTADDLKNWRFGDVTHRDDLAGVIELFSEALVSGKPFEFEVRARRFDGVYRWFESRGAPLCDSDGRIVRWYNLLVDIDQRKRAEHALETREADLRRTLYHLTEGQRLSQTGSFTTDPVMDEHTWSEEFYRICEFEPGCKPSIQKFRDIVHPEDIGTFESIIQRGLAGEDFDHVFRIVTPGDRVKHLRGIGRVVQHLPDRPLFVGAIHDVTAIKLAERILLDREAELQRAQYQLTEAQRLTHTGSYRSNPATDEHFCSEELYRICELEPGSKIKISEFRQLVHIEDRAVYDTMIECSLAGQDSDVVFRIVTASGSIKHLRGIGRVTEYVDGKPIFVGVLQDVSESTRDAITIKARAEELRRSYELMNETQRLSRTGSFLTDLVAEEHNWSEELFRMFELDPATKVTVRTVRDMVQPEDLPAFDEGIQRSMTGADFDLVFRIRTALGNLKFLHAVARVVQHIEGRPLFIGAIQDVTEGKLADQALNRARTELAHVSRAMTIGTLTASIAHEVNQPLSGIITNASTCLRVLAENSPNLDGVRAAVQRLLRDGNRASEVIQRLRTLFSRKPSKMQAVDLNDSAREVLTLSRNELERNGVTLRTEFDQGLPTVPGDRVQLQQVILNLVLNASDAMKAVDDRPRDLVVTTNNEPDGARLSVCDSGVGIDPQNIEKLFSAFFTTKNDGMGIGLSISRSIIEHHNGRLWASANESCGATFSFCIPRGSEDAGIDSEVH